MFSLAWLTLHCMTMRAVQPIDMRGCGGKFRVSTYSSCTLVAGGIEASIPPAGGKQGLASMDRSNSTQALSSQIISD